MTLSCYCDGEMEWWYYPPTDYERLPTQRGRKCCSCGAWIKPLDMCAKFVRERQPRSIIEERIHGDKVPLPPIWMCEGCADQFFNLEELGFCVPLGGLSMRELVREYAEVYGNQSDTVPAKEE